MMSLCLCKGCSLSVERKNEGKKTLRDFNFLGFAQLFQKTLNRNDKSLRVIYHAHMTTEIQTYKCTIFLSYLPSFCI